MNTELECFLEHLPGRLPELILFVMKQFLNRHSFWLRRRERSSIGGNCSIFRSVNWFDNPHLKLHSQSICADRVQFERSSSVSSIFLFISHCDLAFRSTIFVFVEQTLKCEDEAKPVPSLYLQANRIMENECRVAETLILNLLIIAMQSTLYWWRNGSN